MAAGDIACLADYCAYRKVTDSVCVAPDGVKNRNTLFFRVLDCYIFRSGAQYADGLEIFASIDQRFADLHTCYRLLSRFSDAERSRVFFVIQAVINFFICQAFIIY